MHKFKRNESIVERHFRKGNIICHVLLGYYMARFERHLYRIVKEKDLHWYNKTTGEIS